MISSKDISASQRLKAFIRYFLSLRNFANKFSSSSCGSSVRVEFHSFFADLRMSLGLLEYFDLLLSVYNSNIVWFFIFYLSSTSKKVLGAFIALQLPMHSVHPPPLNVGWGGVAGWTSNQIFKKGGGLIGPHHLEEDCWKRGGDFLQNINKMWNI